MSSQQARKSQDLPRGWDHPAPSVAGSSQEAGPFQSKCSSERVATGRSSGDLGAAGTISCCLGSEVGRSLPLGTEPWPIPCQAWAWFSTACWFQGTPGGGPGGCIAPVPRGLSRFAEQRTCSAWALLSARLKVESWALRVCAGHGDA